MPRKPSPNTLKQFALKEVALHCESICYGHKKGSKELAKYIHNEDFVKIAGPFVDWPSSLLEELAKEIYSNRSGHKHLLHLVIQPHITSFSLKLQGSTHTAMNMLTERCTKSLRSLEFIYNNNMPPQYYNEFFGKFRNLTKLNVYASMVDDLGFKAIGENCTKLIELNAGSTWISNVGIKYLSLDDDLIPSFCYQYRLPSLAIIDLSDTRVSGEGLSLLLTCHPNLVKIEHKETFHAFQLAQKQNDPDFKFGLKYLSTIDVFLSPATFEYVLDHCPRVESVTVTSTGLTNEHLYKLMTVKNLTQLHLGNKSYNSFNFYEGVAPVLDAIGVNLTKLVLEEFTEVDVDYIGDKCPNVQHLALSGTLTYAPIGHLNPRYFTKMTSLELWNKIGQDHELAICQNTLKQLLFRSPLTYLLLQRIGNLTDQLFAEILQMNPLLSLRNIVIDYCHNVTSRLFWQLLETPNNLSVMRCWHCKGVNIQDKTDIKSVIKDDNLLLYWEWYPYNEYEELLEAGLIPDDDDEEEEDE